LFIHLLFLIGFRNKAAVLLQWTYSYFTYKRGSRIVTGMDSTQSAGHKPAAVGGTSLQATPREMSAGSIGKQP
jgi:hypothetical protein